MRAAIFRQGKFVVDTIPDPVLADGQVLVRTRACGICGTDLHAVKFPKQYTELSRRSGGRFTMRDDVGIVFGHEFVGEIVTLGPGTTGRFTPGTVVTSMPLTIVGTTVEGIGYNPQIPGAFAEYIPLAERMLLEVPQSMPADYGALVEPMAVGEHAAVYARLTGDEVPLVIGCGPVGLAVIAALKLRGLHPIIAADFSGARRRLAARMGADVVIDPAAASPYGALMEAITPEGFDPSRYAQLTGAALKRRSSVLFECVGVPGVMQAMFEGAPPGARIVIVGVCMETDAFEPFFGILKQLDVQFVLGYTPDEFAATLGNIAAGRINVASLITGRVGLDGVGAAFADLANPEAHAKILVEPGR